MTGWKKSPCSIGKYIDSFRAWSHFPSQSRTFVLADPTPYCLAFVALEVWMWHRATTNRMKVPKVWLTIRYHQAGPWQRGWQVKEATVFFVGLATRKGKDIHGGVETPTQKYQKCKDVLNMVGVCRNETYLTLFFLLLFWYPCLRVIPAEVNSRLDRVLGVQSVMLPYMWWHWKPRVCVSSKWYPPWP